MFFISSIIYIFASNDDYINNILINNGPSSNKNLKKGGKCYLYLIFDSGEQKS